MDLLIAILMLAGALLVLIGSIGLHRLPDFYARLHGPTKATTLGMAGLLMASMIYFTRLHGFLSIHEVLITLLLFITAPITAHMLAKTALQKRIRMLPRTHGRDLSEAAAERLPPS